MIPGFFETRSIVSLYYCSISLPTNTLTRSRVITYPRDLVTCLQAWWMWLSPSGPRISIHYLDVQILILIHYASTHPHWKYLSYAFQTLILLVATNVVKATADDSDYVWSHSLRNKLQCFLVYCKLELVNRSCYITNVGCVHHVQHDFIVNGVKSPWSWNRWSSITQWTSNKRITRDLVVIYHTCIKVSA